MKKILLICNYYAPENQIASIRLSKFAKYLTRYGYDVQVLVEKKQLDIRDEILEEDVAGIPVEYVDFSGWVSKLDDFYTRLTKSYREKNFADVSSRMRYNRKAGQVIFYPFEKQHPVMGTFDYLLKIIKQHNLYHNSKGYLRQVKDNVDVCFSTYGGYFGHFAGNYIKRLNRSIKWIADFRDPVYRFNFDPVFFAPVAKLYEFWSCIKCDEIVVVTKGMARRLPAFCRKKLHCITNGFDREEQKYCRDIRKKDKFVISYTGRMYGGMQDVSAAFQVMRELVDEKHIDAETLAFHYAGTGFRIFKGQAEKYGLGDRCIDFGNVGRKDSLRIQAESDMLLMAAWDYKCQTIGALTGKILEYMQHEKPVIAVINGDVENNELAGVVREAGLGAAYEQSHHDRDIAALKQYIKMQYGCWMDSGRLQMNLDKKRIVRYEYRNLTKRLIRLIEK